MKEEWLAYARTNGIDDRLGPFVSEYLRAAASKSAVVVCTCSTLGPIAETLCLPNVFRVDQPMMHAAVRHHGKILLALCLESTVRASSQLLEKAYDQQNRRPNYEVVLCPEAWPFFEQGQNDEFGQTIASIVRERVTQTDKPGCIVLAQASMSVAEPYLVDIALPVLSSPVLAVREAVRLALEV